MSTILKALQRLEDEKNSGKDRSLNEQVVARRSGAVAKSRWAVIGVALLSGIAVGSTALFFWPDGGAPAENGVTEAAQPVVASSATQSKPAQRVPKPPARALGADPSARAKQSEAAADRATTPAFTMVEVVERLERKSPADSAIADASALEPVVAESPALEPSGPGTNRPGDRRRAARLRAAKERSESKPSERGNSRPAAAALRRAPEPQIAAPPVVIAAADPVEEIPEKITPTVEQADVIPDPPLGTAESSQPLSVSTPPSAPPTRDRRVLYRAEIPLISVDKTIWHPDVDRRLAIVELTESGEELRLKEGDAVGPLVVETIRPSGVLFVHDGVEIEYRVGQ